MHQKTTLHDLLPEIKESFSKTPFSTRKATKSLNLLLHYITNNKLKPDHAKNLFFYILRGLNSEDIYLKSLLYSSLMQLKKQTSESFLAISSLIKDLNSDHSQIIKSKALMTLFVICPRLMINDFDKYVTQSFISHSDVRKRSAVLSTLLYSDEKGIIKKWVMNLELFKDSSITGYHVLSLLSYIKDKNALQSLDYAKYSSCCSMLIVKMAYQSKFSIIDDILKMYLKRGDEMTLIEVCRVISKLEYKDIYMSSVISVLQGMLRSSKKHVKFAAMRTILMYIEDSSKGNSEQEHNHSDSPNDFSHQNFSAVQYFNNNYTVPMISSNSSNFSSLSLLNKDIEDLLTSKNKTLSMMAITTLLNTGTEETIERLLNTLPEMINEMTDSFKKVVISALLNMSKKKEKEDIFLRFVQKCIYNKGSIEFKRYLINVLKNLLTNSKNTCMAESRDESKDERCDSLPYVLDILSSFIEDSPSPILTMDILNLMGIFVGNCKNYEKYIVHILNRLILENSYVRCAALQSLFFISLKKAEIKEKVFKIFLKYKNDEDELVAEECNFLMRKMELNQYKEDNDSNSKSEQTNTMQLNSNTLRLSTAALRSNVNLDSPDFLLVNNFNGLRNEILEFLSENEKSILNLNFNAKIESTKKISKEINLCENEDFKICVKKEIVKNGIKLNFEIQNFLENVFFRGGKINLIIKNKKVNEKCSIKIDFTKDENTNDNQSECFSIEKTIKINVQKESIKNTEDIIDDFLFDTAFDLNVLDPFVINSNFVYDICMDEDFDEKETEKIILNPFLIDVFDFMENGNNGNFLYNEKLNVKLNEKDLLIAKNKIIEMFNMKYESKSSKSGFELVFTGSYNNKNMRIKVNCNTKFVCEVEINSECEDLLKAAVQKFT